MDLKQLAAPFPASDVEWRVQSSGAKGDGTVWARVLAYITNRAIMERLDDVCGPANWRNEFRHGPDGAVLCGISILVFRGDDMEWVTKWDGAENTDVEAVKGGLSGAMKRAGYQWGIGRYLYQLEEGFAKVSDRGAHFAKTKDGKTFKWDAPDLPAWALPSGAKTETGNVTTAVRVDRGEAQPNSRRDASQPAPSSAPHAQTATDGTDDPSCPKCGGRMWDNRITKRNPRAPDFKCRTRSCDGVVWPTRSEPEPGEIPTSYDGPYEDSDLPF